MLTTNELTEALTVEAAAAPTNPGRLGQVHGRVTVRRRRRAAAAALASVGVIVAAAVIVPNLGAGPDRTLPVTPSPSATGDIPLPEYHLGGRLIAQEEHTGGEAFAMQFTPSSAQLMFTVDCYVPGEDAQDGIDLRMVELDVNGAPVGRVSCSGGPEFTGANTFTPEPASLSSVSPGTATSLRVTLNGRKAPAATRLRVGVYAGVPRPDYPFPAAPDPLPELEPYANLDPALATRPLDLVSAGPLPTISYPATIVGPTGRWSETFTPTHGLTITSQMAAPGTLRVSVDGTVVWAINGWDYANAVFEDSRSLTQLGITSGEPVTVTIVAAGFSGDSWAVLLSDSTHS